MKLFERSEQQIFDEVIEHARRQKRKSIDPRTGNCLYRGPNGVKCFIGALISDEDYCPEMDTGNTVHSLAINFKNNVGDGSIMKINLATLLQNVHDHNIECFYWEKEFEQIAEKFNLIYTPPKEMQ